MVGFTEPQKQTDTDSWINIVDEEDPRGRVGVHWPWEKKSYENDGKNNTNESNDDAHNKK